MVLLVRQVFAFTHSHYTTYACRAITATTATTAPIKWERDGYKFIDLFSKAAIKALLFKPTF
jgi:hypothetical protein